MEVLNEKNGSDTELLMFGMTLINKVTHQKPAIQNLRLPHQPLVLPPLSLSHPPNPSDSVSSSRSGFVL